MFHQPHFAASTSSSLEFVNALKDALPVELSMCVLGSLGGIREDFGCLGNAIAAVIYERRPASFSSSISETDFLCLYTVNTAVRIFVQLFPL